jgi:hypothetical protein
MIRRLTLFALILNLSLAYALAQDFKTEKVIFITLDGLRWQELFTGADTWLIRNTKYVEDTTALLNAYWADSPQERRKLLLPFIWSAVVDEGSLYGNRTMGCEVGLTNNMWFSYPGYNEILTGQADDKNINSNDELLNPNVTVLEYLNKQNRYSGSVAVFTSWDLFPWIIHEERSGVLVNAGFDTCSDADATILEKSANLLQPLIPSPWSTVRLDAFTHLYAFEFLRRKKPDVLYIAYGETDDFAHDGQYDAYLTSANRTDGFVRQLWEWSQSDPAYKDKTTLIISTDHGRGIKEEWTSHSTKVKGSDQTWFIALGPDFKVRGEVSRNESYFNNQYAATIAYLLGYDFNMHGTKGEVIKKLFE